MCLQPVYRRISLALAEYLDYLPRTSAKIDMYLHSFAIVLGFEVDFPGRLADTGNRSASASFDCFRYLIRNGQLSTGGTTVSQVTSIRVPTSGNAIRCKIFRRSSSEYVVPVQKSALYLQDM